MKKYIFITEFVVLWGALSGSAIKPAAENTAALENTATVAQAAVVIENDSEQKILGEQLVDAVEKKNLAKVNQLIAQNAPVNMVTQRGTSILGEAAQRSSFEIVKALLAADAKVNTKDKYGDTALMSAIMYSDSQRKEQAFSISCELLNAGAEVNMQNEYRMTALLFAAQKGYDEIVEMLIFAGANPNLKGMAGTVFDYGSLPKTRAALENALKKRAHILHTIKQRCAVKHQAVENYLPPVLADLVVDYEYDAGYTAKESTFDVQDIRKWLPDFAE